MSREADARVWRWHEERGRACSLDRAVTVVITSTETRIEIRGRVMHVLEVKSERWRQRWRGDERWELGRQFSRARHHACLRHFFTSPHTATTMYNMLPDSATEICN